MTSSLHSVMMMHLEEYEDLQNTVFVPVDNRNEPINTTSLPNTEVIVKRCFNKWDRIIFDVKQHKIRKALEDSINIDSYDCIHAYTLFTDGNCAMQLSKKYGIPYIVAVRNTDVNEFFKKLPYLRTRGIQIMKKASAICFLSESYKTRIFDQYVPNELRRELEEKSYVIPNGIDDFWLDNIFQGEHKLHSPLRLIYAGGINANKNVEATIAAINDLMNKNVKAELTIVGEIYDTNIIRRISRFDFVYYHEAVVKEKLIDFYRENDIFVMPSFTETFGLVYAEALSQGLPIIYTKGEGFDNQFPEGAVGYHVNPNGSNDIASAILKICERYPEIVESTTESAQRFNWTEIVSKYYQLYKEIVH